MAKKEVFQWLITGAKTIDVRKGAAWDGNDALFLSGPRSLKLQIVRKETGKLTQVIRQDNFLSVIPTAKTVSEAQDYLRRLYGDGEGTFTAYYLSKPNH